VPLVLLLFFWIGPCMTLRADPPIEVLELQSRTAEEVIPVLRPLLGEADSITGMGSSLIIKAPPARVREIRQALLALDRPPQRLLISVDNRGDGLRRSSGYRGSVDIVGDEGHIGINSPGKPGDTSQARIRLHNRATSGSSRSDFQVQALEGRPAYISSGVRLPLQERQRYYADGVIHERRTTQLQDVTAGFYVVPRLQGDSVTLEILQHDDRAGRGMVHTQSAGTVVRGRLGEWLDLGAVATETNIEESGLARGRSVEGSGRMHISVRVDCLDCGDAGQRLRPASPAGMR